MGNLNEVRTVLFDLLIDCFTSYGRLYKYHIAWKRAEENAREATKITYSEAKGEIDE
jgi:hypothetical protein